ncbi:MAG: group III truncated hemoglobin [Flavobacteriaceae bacterium]
MKNDILNRKDVEVLVDEFYERVRKDEVIGYLFNEIAQTDWSHHLPKMYDFWEVILFGTGSFKGNPMQVHRELHHKSPLSSEQFQHWFKLFADTVNNLYEGKNAEDIKQSASNIAQTMMYKVLS